MPKSAQDSFAQQYKHQIRVRQPRLMSRQCPKTEGTCTGRSWGVEGGREGRLAVLDGKRSDLKPQCSQSGLTLARRLEVLAFGEKEAREATMLLLASRTLSLNKFPMKRQRLPHTLRLTLPSFLLNFNQMAATATFLLARTRS